MPANLNALIRYKTIDNYLRASKYGCSIEKMIDLCSEALAEHRGVYKQVSERTIRDDIRVMRSDILSFNAPIVFKDGKYFYDNPDYSIFDISVSERKILVQILEMLLEEKDHIQHENLVNILERLADMTGIELPVEQEETDAKYDLLEPPIASSAPSMPVGAMPPGSEPQFKSSLIIYKSEMQKRFSWRELFGLFR